MTHQGIKITGRIDSEFSKDHGIRKEHVRVSKDVDALATTVIDAAFEKN